MLAYVDNMFDKQRFIVYNYSVIFYNVCSYMR